MEKIVFTSHRRGRRQKLMEIERNMQAIVRQTDSEEKMQTDARAQVDEDACKYVRVKRFVRYVELLLVEIRKYRIHRTPHRQTREVCLRPAEEPYIALMQMIHPVISNQQRRALRRRMLQSTAPSADFTHGELRTI